jgi:hypothetical protein
MAGLIARLSATTFPRTTSFLAPVLFVDLLALAGLLITLAAFVHVALLVRRSMLLVLISRKPESEPFFRSVLARPPPNGK